MQNKLYIVLLILMAGVASASAMAITRTNGGKTTGPWKYGTIGAPVVPFSLGVNIHFTHPRPGEMRMISEAGFRWIRMDLFWQRTEKKKGQYDFAKYDYLLSRLAPYHIRPLFILDWTNVLYQHGEPPTTHAARAAFCRWVVAVMKHFAGHGIIWEMWSEPNANFTSGTGPNRRVNADDYAKLAIDTGRTIRRTAPHELYVGPGLLGTMNRPFLQACFQAGTLHYWNAVTIHPYRKGRPETVVPEYAKLRRLMARYLPAGRNIPVLTSEWGYSTTWAAGSNAVQARYTARELLVNLSNEIPLSIYYDWRNDGPNLKAREENFGLVDYKYHPGANPVYKPKPAYFAVRNLAIQLHNCHFSGRLALGGPDDYLLGFNAPNKRVIVAWTISPTKPHDVELTVPTGKYELVNETGTKTSYMVAHHGKITIHITYDPEYLKQR